jgi:hypothetical protein
MLRAHWRGVDGAGHDPARWAAAVGLLSAAGAATGGYVVYDRVLADPGARVAAAAQALEEGEGFTARVERSYTTAYAEEVAEETGESAEAVLAGSAAEEEYLYSAADRAFLVRGGAMGEGTVAVAAHRGEVYVYAP